MVPLLANNIASDDADQNPDFLPCYPRLYLTTKSVICVALEPATPSVTVTLKSYLPGARVFNANSSPNGIRSPSCPALFSRRCGELNTACTSRSTVVCTINCGLPAASRFAL